MRRLLAALAVGILLAALPAPAQAWENGPARTPPMGFNTWTALGCSPAFNANSVRQLADAMAFGGYRSAGYEYLVIDDCWAEPERDAEGNLVPDRTRFPNGIEPVIDYVHRRGLKFGIYADAGTWTCHPEQGFPGSLDHEDQDAALFASWGVDYLKYDNCHADDRPAQERFTRMRDALARTGRPIAYAIYEWSSNEPWTWAPEVANSWWSAGMFEDVWASLRDKIRANLPLASYAGPGAWNDPYILQVGNGGMTDTEYRTHFSLWAMMASPMMISTDLRTADAQTRRILLNRDLIAINQDSQGVQGSVISSDAGRLVITKPLADGDVAVALYNETDQPAVIGADLSEAGLPAAPKYRIRDLWTHRVRYTGPSLSARVPAHGTAVFRVARP